MEHKFVEMAKERLNTLQDDAFIRKQVHSKSPKNNQSGMICSGEQTILLFHLNKSHLMTVQKILSILISDQNGILTITNDTFLFTENDSDLEYLFEMQSEAEWLYKEKLGYRNHLYIIGGGHCSLAFSKLMSTMDFYIHLYDHRNDINTFNENNFVHEKKIIPDYSLLSDLIPSGNNIYTVIMTLGYRTDDLALRSLINRDFKYLGVLGSAAKIESMFNEWRKDLLPEDKLKKIHAPLGLDIHSRSPEEIAISIAAEIIWVKNEK